MRLPFDANAIKVVLDSYQKLKEFPCVYAKLKEDVYTNILNATVNQQTLLV